MSTDTESTIYTQAVAQFFIDDGRFIVDGLHDGILSSFVVSALDYPAFVYTVKYVADLVVLIPQHDYSSYRRDFEKLSDRQFFKDRGIGFFVLSDSNWLDHTMAFIIANANKRPKLRDL